MQDYLVTLECAPANTFRCIKAANSVDLNLAEKLRHELSVSADLQTPFNIGLIVGASGSGKTTLAQEMFGSIPASLLNLDVPIIDQLPEHMTYDECAQALSSVGLGSVPCWVRPAVTLSNGQRCRAECALIMAHNHETIRVIDEWTSVVDRTAGKIMSLCIAKHARRMNARIVLLSCHYDVIEWINPDWIIDCNAQTYTERRHLWQHAKRTERLRFEVKQCDRRAWRYFSKYHYLNHNLPGGKVDTFGLFEGATQIGFVCFAVYVANRQNIIHANRLVIHPDYIGMGLGIRLVDATSHIMAQRGYDVRGKFTSLSQAKECMRRPWWIQTAGGLIHKMQRTSKMQKSTFRLDVQTTSWKFDDARYVKEHAA